MEKTKIFLIFIFILAAALRFWGLGSNPPSMAWDEVAWGYNAYTIGIDGRDEFGRFLPYDYLESFGDFKPPVYAYLTVIPVKLFGLNEFATRFPSALFGSLTVLVTYFLVREIFFIRESSRIKRQMDSNVIALGAAFLLAISPWHIMLSRAAFEANIATFFIATGVWLFLFAVNKNAWLLILSAISFVLSINTFNSARIVSPLLVLILTFAFWRILLKNWKQTVIAFLVGLICFAPVVPHLLSPQARLRFQEVNIFSDIEVVERANQQIENNDGAWWSKILHNRRVGYGIEFARHYLENLTPQFLFINGDGNPKFSTRVVGQLYLWELPFLVLGFLFLFKRREGHWWIVPLWLLIGIIPAGTARETPHALRIETTLPTFQILIAYGIFWAYVFVKEYKVYSIKYIVLRNILYSTFFILISLQFIYFLHNYSQHYPYDYSGEWQYGYKQSAEYVKDVVDDYDRVVVTTEIGRPYAYYTFYLQTNPNEFRETARITRSPFGFVDIDGFGKYTFAKNVHQVEVGENEKVLFVNKASEVPDNANVLKRIPLLNGKEALVVYSL